MLDRQMIKKNVYCPNCRKVGHIIRECKIPIMSYGIICIKLSDELEIKPYQIDNYISKSYIDLDELNFTNISKLCKYDEYMKKIKFLIVQRKHSFSYVDFMRGKYDINDDTTIKMLFSMMSNIELENIKTKTFETLWNELWGKTSNYKIYQREFELSREKFNQLKINLDDYIDKNKVNNSPEWGFPKGRKDKNENNIDCAIREFYEETNITKDKFKVLNKIPPLEENVQGFDNTKYKLTYYLGLLNDDVKLSVESETQSYEIGDIKWVSIDEFVKLVRPYYEDKIKIIYKVFFSMINIIESIKDYNDITKNSHFINDLIEIKE